MRALVVGGGVIGLAVAEELARRGIQVTLFEKNPRLGEEASSAAAGILTPQGEAKEPGPFHTILSASYGMFPEFLARLKKLTGMDPDFRVPGMLNLAATDQEERELSQEIDWHQKGGIQVERLSAEKARKLEPALDGPLRWAGWWPQAAQLDPVLLVAALKKALELQGGELRVGEPVEKILLQAGRAEGVQTSRGNYQADWTILCAGPWSGSYESLPFSIPVIPARGQLLQLATPCALIERIVFASSAYLVQRTATRLIAGTTVEYVGFDKSVTAQATRTIGEGVKKISSKTGTLKVESSWAALRPDTPDHLPILGSSPVNGLLLAVGHFRNGLQLAPLTAAVMADLAMAKQLVPDLAPFSLHRFSAQTTAKLL